jgi:hypothetical protein
MQTHHRESFSAELKHSCPVGPACSQKHNRGPPDATLTTNCSPNKPWRWSAKRPLTVWIPEAVSKSLWLAYNLVTHLVVTVPCCCKMFFLFLTSTYYLTNLSPTPATKDFASVHRPPLRISTTSVTHNDAPSSHHAMSSKSLRSKVHMSAIWSISACKSVLSDHHQDRRVRAHPDKATVHADGRGETHAVDSSPVQGTVK